MSCVNPVQCKNAITKHQSEFLNLFKALLLLRGVVRMGVLFFVCIGLFSLLVRGNCVNADDGQILLLTCPSSNMINSINFAAWGAFCNEISHSWCDTSHGQSICPPGNYWWYCTTTNAAPIVQSLCLNKDECSISAVRSVFGEPPLNCQIEGAHWSLYVDYSCGPIPTTLPGNYTTKTLQTLPPPLNGPVVDHNNFLAYASLITQPFLADPQNRFSKLIEQGVEELFIPFFSQTQRVLSQWKVCEGTIKDRTCYNWMDLYFGDPRSKFELNYEYGSATIGPGNNHGGSINVIAKLNFASRALMGGVYYEVKKFSGICSCMDIVSCSSADNQFISFGGEIFVNTTINFVLDQTSYQLTSTVAKNNVILDKWWHSDIPDGCNQENVFTGTLDSWLGETKYYLGQTYLQQQIDKQSIFIGPLLVPPSVQKEVGPSTNLTFGFNVTQMDWNQNSYISAFIMGNTTFLNLTDGTTRNFVPTKHDALNPPLPIQCCDANLLTELMISTSTVEDAVYAACGVLTASKKPIRIAGVDFIGGIEMYDPPSISVPDENALRGNVSDVRIIVKCNSTNTNTTNTTGSEFSQITFFDIEIQNLVMYFKPMFNSTADSWYVQIVGANLTNATFIFHEPALPSGSIFNEFAQQLFNRFVDDFNNVLSMIFIPIPENAVLPLQNVVTKIVRFDVPGDFGYISIQSFNKTSDKHSDKQQNDKHRNNEQQNYNEPSVVERVEQNNQKTEGGLYVGTIIRSIGKSSTMSCSLNFTDKVGIDYVEYEVCSPLKYAGFSRLDVNNRLWTGCNDSSCLYCESENVIENQCENNTIYGKSVCFSEFVSNGNLYIVHSDNSCNNYVTTGEMVMIDGTRTDECYNGYEMSYKIYYFVNSNNIGVSIYSSLNCGFGFQGRFDMYINGCVDIPDGSLRIINNNDAISCKIESTSQMIVNMIILLTIVCITMLTLVGVFCFRVFSKSKQLMKDECVQIFIELKSIPGMLPIILNLFVCCICLIAWSTLFFIPSENIYNNATLSDDMVEKLDQWKNTGIVLFGVLSTALLLFITFTIFRGQILKESICYALLFIPIACQMCLLIIPPLSGQIIFDKMFNTTLPLGVDPIYASLVKFKDKGLIRIPFSIVTEEIMAIFDGFVCSLLTYPFYLTVDIPKYIPKLLFLGYINVCLCLTVLLLYYYQLSGTTWVILLCYTTKILINVLVYFFPIRKLVRLIQIGVLILTSVFTWVFISNDGLSAMGHYIIFQIVSFISMFCIIHGLSSLLPEMNLTEVDNSDNIGVVTDTINGDVELTVELEEVEKHVDETIPLLSNRRRNMIFQKFSTTHIYQFMLQKLKYIWQKVMDLWIWLCDEKEHKQNPFQRMKKRRLYVFVGCIFMLGLNILNIVSFIKYESSPTKMVSALFTSYGIQLTFNVPTPAFDETFNVFYGLSVVCLLLNVVSLGSFIMSIVSDTGENRTDSLWKSRMWIFIALISLIISIILNLFPNYASLIDVKGLLPPCGGDLEEEVRELFNLSLNLFFSVVILAKLGFILTAIPLSLIHASEEILHTCPSNSLLHSLTIIFGLFGPFIVAFPIMIIVQLSYSISQFHTVPDGLIPLACCFVILPCILYVISVSIHHHFSYKKRMIWYYIFPICLHFALEFALFGVLFGFGTVIRGILTMEFVIIFGADCCLVVIILSDALLSALISKD